VGNSYCSGTSQPSTTQSCTNTSYTWQYSNWGSCSSTCGGGTQTRTVWCVDNLGYTVNNWQCTGTMPSTSQSCNTQPCASYSWVTGTWGTCNNGQQTRSVTCQNNSTGAIVGNSYCSGTSQPSTTQSCISYTYSWITGTWGSCINGTQTRSVACQRNDGYIASDSYCLS
ncbi:MAG: thrombospondin type-1 domain-containing protein, partial [bacterium]